MRILVTGIASDIGFNCGRLLRTLEGVDAIHGIDITADHAGACVFDACAVAPRATEDRYPAWLADYVARHRIDFILPTSEAEIGRLSTSGTALLQDAKLVIANRSVVATALDKHECLSVLAAHGIPVPAHGLVGGAPPNIWPVIVKPRAGQGSKGIMAIGGMEDYNRIAPPGSVWQALLLPAEEEYTCAVYRSPVAGTRILSLRRSLHGGLTGKGEVVEDEQIRDYVDSIAQALDLNGAMNVQLRRTANGPRLFEINPRLSSTLMFRHILGFCDLEWWLRDLAGEDVPDYRPPPPGTRFYRGSQEYVVRP